MTHCISNDLVCDNINHCPDGTDEATTPTCQGAEITGIQTLIVYIYKIFKGIFSFLNNF